MGEESQGGQKNNIWPLLNLWMKLMSRAITAITKWLEEKNSNYSGFITFGEEKS